MCVYRLQPPLPPHSTWRLHQQHTTRTIRTYRAPQVITPSTLPSAAAPSSALPTRTLSAQSYSRKGKRRAKPFQQEQQQLLQQQQNLAPILLAAIQGKEAGKVGPVRWRVLLGCAATGRLCAAGGHAGTSGLALWFTQSSGPWGTCLA